MPADYTLAAQLLADTLPGVTPAAFHGLLVGQICSGVVQPDPDDVSELLTHELLPVVRKFADGLVSEANDKLGGLEYSFQPLLPDDEIALSRRVHELGLWCGHFTMGFAAGYLRPESDLSSEAREILRDFSQLSSLSAEESKVDEQDEENYMELVEYVRMAAITLYQQLVGMRTSREDEETPPRPTMH